MTMKGMTINVPTAWVDPLHSWDLWMRAAHRPATTRYLRDYQVRRFASDFRGQPWEVTTDDLVAWIGDKQWGAETKRSYRTALRGFYTWAFLTGRVQISPAGLLPPIQAQKRLPRPTPEIVLHTALMAATPRVRVMVLLAARQGLRRGEIAQVHTRDLEADLFGFSLRVHGKGSKERIVPLCEEVQALLDEMPQGFVFPGKIGGHLSPSRVGELVSEVLGPGWTTHTLRHRFATACYAGERDLLAVQGLLGHSKPETTLQYVLLPIDAMRRAAAWAA